MSILPNEGTGTDDSITDSPLLSPRDASGTARFFYFHRQPSHFFPRCSGRAWTARGTRRRMRQNYRRSSPPTRPDDRWDGRTQGWYPSVSRCSSTRPHNLWRCRDFSSIRRCEFSRGRNSVRDSPFAFQPLETLLSSLSSDFAVTSDVLPLIYLQMPTSKDSPIEESPFDLPLVTIPPHLTDAELLNVVVPPASSTGLRGDEGVGYEGVRMYLRLFEDAVRSSTSTVSSY